MKEVRSKILDDIIKLMDQEDGKKLMKNPKLVAAKITVAKPMDKMKQEEESLMEDEPLMDEMKEDSELEPVEDKAEGGLESLLSSLTEEEKKQLLAHLQ